MASVKAEKPAVGSQLFGQVKKEPAKAGEGASKAPTSKQAAPKKGEQKPREPKKKAAKGGKPGGKK